MLVSLALDGDARKTLPPPDAPSNTWPEITPAGLADKEKTETGFRAAYS